MAKVKFSSKVIKATDTDVGFMIQDIFGLMPEETEIFEIQSIYVSPEFRGQGLASTLIKQSVDLHKDKIVCCAAGASTEEYSVEPSRDQYAEILEGMYRFWTKQGFVSINNFVRYETKEAFVYPNEKGLALLREIERVLNE